MLNSAPLAQHGPGAQASGRVALVTGCARTDGLGQAIARRLSASGHTVVASDISLGGARNKHEDANGPDSGLAGLVTELEISFGGGAMAVGDVSSAEDSARMVQESVERFGRLDILVNNAAAPRGDESGSIETVDPVEWDRVMAVNARGPFLMCRAAIPAMKTQGWGRIINVASLAGRVGLPGLAIYCASKHASVGLTRALALDLAPFGITANAVCPGPVLTDRALDSARGKGGDPDEVLQERARAVPVGRLGLPADIAGLVDFIASDDSGFLTGQTLGIDGGALAA
jgi:3-oxoacyl-[acyl-carrier protein] reductase